MNHDSAPAYGLWPLVLINSLVFIIFAFSFYHPKTKMDWRSFGAFSGFIVALFAEMYGFPLTLFLLSGWLSSRLGNVDIYSHDSGHLWYTLLGLHGNPHSNPLHLLSNLVILLGFVLLSAAWSVLFAAQHSGKLATTGPYAYVRHPQYVAFIIIMIGFLLQWPTLLTLLMFPVLVMMYFKLAVREEGIVAAEFGQEYASYADRTPRFIPFTKPARLLAPRS